MQAVRWVPRGMLAERAPSEERARGERQASVSVSRGGRVGTLAVSRGGVSRQPWRSGRDFSRQPWRCQPSAVAVGSGLLARLGSGRMAGSRWQMPKAEVWRLFFSAMPKAPFCRWRWHRWRQSEPTRRGGKAKPPAVAPPAANGAQASREKSRQTERRHCQRCQPSAPSRAEPADPTRPPRLTADTPTADG